MKAIKVQKGDRYERLSIIKEQIDGSRDRKFFVECDCGKRFVTRLASMRSGGTKSCGCWNRESAKINNTKHGHNTRKNGTTRTYTTWASILQRCTNPKEKSYIRYGGRGIKVCKKWLSFENFLKDMGERPENSSIDRINNNKGYYKSNCRWASLKQQANNKRNNKMLTYNGITLNLSQWSKKTGINRETLLWRIKNGYTPKQVIEHKKYANKKL